jgi:hypothetical protein
MAWDEWEQLKAEAAARSGSTHTQINHLADPDGGGGATSSVTGGLRSTKAAWTKAGDSVGGQRDGLGKALTALKTGQRGLGETAGCLTAAAQRKVLTSWTHYAQGLDEKCGALQKVLDQTGHDLLLTDDAVRAALEQVDTTYKDTTAVGGGTGSR